MEKKDFKCVICNAPGHDSVNGVVGCRDCIGLVRAYDHYNESVKSGNTLHLKKAGIGDVNSQEKGSGARFNNGKLDFSLIPLCTLEDEVRVWEYGKAKYAAFNWTKGMPWSIPFACMMRHMAAWQRGEANDLESGLPHLAHAMCNLRMLTLYATNYTEGDDRPVEQLK